MIIPVTVVDCVPSFETEEGREVWLTMVACTIFFKSICSGTYKHEDGKRARTENMVKKGPVLTKIEKKTLELAKIDAVWAFVEMGRHGYDTRDDSDGRVRNIDEYEDPWLELQELRFVPVRYRHAVRFIMHFACAIVAERYRFEMMGNDIKHQVNVEHLKTRLALDMEDFLGYQARDLLLLMMDQVKIRLRDGYEVWSLVSLIYKTETWKDEHLGEDWAPPTFTPEFNSRLAAQVSWDVSQLCLNVVICVLMISLSL